MFYEPANLKMISKRAEKQLIDAGLDLVITDPVYGESAEPERAILELKKQEWDFLFVNIINWIDTRGVFRVLHEFRNEPMILYSFGGFTDHEGRFGRKEHSYHLLLVPVLLPSACQCSNGESNSSISSMLRIVQWI